MESKPPGAAKSLALDIPPKLLLLAAVTGALAWGGCGVVADDDATQLATCESEPALSWENFGEGFMLQNCTPCHHSQLPADQRVGAPVGVDFDTYRGVLTFAERVRARTLDAQTMPPGGGIPQGELLRMDEWLSCQVAEDLAWLEENEGGGS